MGYVVALALVALGAYFLWHSYDAETGVNFKNGAAAVGTLFGAAAAWFSDFLEGLPF